MMRHFLDFERAIGELEGKIQELRHLSTSSELNIAEEVGRLEASATRLLRQTYARLTPWQKVQVARHPERPHTLDYVSGLLTDFIPLAGDRAFEQLVIRAGCHGKSQHDRRHAQSSQQPLAPHDVVSLCLRMLP